MSWLEIVKARIDLLRAIDPERQIFGAALHGHRVGAPLSAAALAALEEQVGGPLPSEYRAMLEALQGEGAGPYYGLVAPAVPEVEVKRGRAGPSAARPFVAEGDTPHDAEVGKGAHLLDGTLVVADQGCGGRSLLVVTGPHRGEVWTDWTRERGPVGPEAASFGEWYAAWVGRALIDWAKRAMARVALAGGASEAEREAMALVRGPLSRVAPDDPEVMRALGYLELAEQRWDAAEQAFEAACAAALAVAPDEDERDVDDEDVDDEDVDDEDVDIDDEDDNQVGDGIDSGEARARLALDTARTLILRERHELALATARAALTGDDLWASTESELKDAIERALRGLGRIDEALTVLDEQAESHFFDFDLHHRLAGEHLGRGDVAAAARVLERAARFQFILMPPQPLAARVSAAFEPMVAALVAAGREADAEALTAHAATITETP